MIRHAQKPQPYLDQSFEKRRRERDGGGVGQPVVAVALKVPQITFVSKRRIARDFLLSGGLITQTNSMLCKGIPDPGPSPVRADC